MQEFRSYIGSGKCYLRDANGTGGLQFVGIVSKLELAITDQRIDQRDWTAPGGGLAKSITRISSVDLNIALDSLHEENLAKAVYGAAVYTAAGTATDEVHASVAVGDLVPLAHVGATSVVVKDNATGLVSYVENVDYQVTGAGLVSLTIDEGIKVSYSYPKQSATHALVDKQRTWTLVFDGLNEAENGTPCVVTVPKVVFSPAKNISLISDEFGVLDLSAQVLKDPSQPAGQSQYFKIQYTSLA